MSESFLEKPIGMLDRVVSVAVFVVAILLVGFMMIRVGIAAMDFVAHLANPAPEHANTDEPSFRMLHAIALVLVFVKAYRLLVAYARHHHVSIRFVVEISIIAPAVEIIFNSQEYSLDMLILLGSYGVLNLFLFLMFQDRLQEPEGHGG